MHQFIKQLSVFVGVLLLYFILTFALNAYIFSTEKPLPKKSRVLIMGDSHSQKALNPMLFSDAQNISQTAEPYVVTYWKLKKVLSFNKPDTLILSFAPHNLSAFNDLKFSSTQWAPEMFRRIYPIADLNDVSDYIDVDFMTYYKTIWKHAAIFPRFNHKNYVGRYNNNKRSNIDDVDEAIKRHFLREGKNLGVSSVSLMYLDSIISICLKNEITPLLVTSPVHQRYSREIPRESMDAFIAAKKNYSEQNVLFLDGMQAIYADSLFLNADHLNAKGAVRFTNDLISYTKKIKSFRFDVKSTESFVLDGSW